MRSAQVLLYTALIVVNLTFIAAWIVTTRRRRLAGRPAASDIAIGVGTNFLDTLGIGNFAQITALFKLRGRPSDELIPGTLNMGNAIPSFVGSFLFVISTDVEPLLLACMIGSSALGAWLGAGIVSRMPRRAIQQFMGVALLVAAFFFTMTNIGILPPAGTAMALSGWRFALAVGANFVLGALMCIGIGNYAPSMVILGLLGMHPLAAYPIMIGSDGLLIPVASLGFLKSDGSPRVLSGPRDRRHRGDFAGISVGQLGGLAPGRNALAGDRRGHLCRNFHAQVGAAGCKSAGSGRTIRRSLTAPLRDVIICEKQRRVQGSSWPVTCKGPRL